MCLAIYQPAGKTVSELHLRNGFSNHEDGAGFAWAVNGQLFVKKGIFDVEEVIRHYETIKEYPCLIHFRKATHGKIDETNCHPFLFNDNKLALIHNGILSIKCTMDGLSDTAHFVKQVLEPMVKRNNVPIGDGALQYLLSTSIGTDKMVIMDGDGTTYVINEDKGKWEGGVWYSNMSFSYTYTKPTVYQYKGGGGTYFDRTGQGHAPSPSYALHKDNWRKKFEDGAEDDESYLEFWKRTAKSEQSIGTCCPVDHRKTQKIPLLLTDVVDDAGNVTVIDGENVEDYINKIEAEEKTYTPGTMCDYGWWDEEIEADIEKHMKNTGCRREDAIIRVFNAK